MRRRTTVRFAEVDDEVDEEGPSDDVKTEMASLVCCASGGWGGG